MTTMTATTTITTVLPKDAEDGVRPMMDCADAVFVKTYEDTYKSLNAAKSFHEGPQRRKTLSLESISPKHAKSCRFFLRLSAETATNVKSLYDYSATSSSGLLGLLSMLESGYQTCTFVHKVGRYHLTNVAARSGIMAPIDSASWDKLLVFTQSLVHSKFLDGKRICLHKGRTAIHQGSSSFHQNALTRALDSNDSKVLANLAACIVWMLDTKYMNKSYETQNSAAGTFSHNTSTLLCRNYTPPVAEPQPKKAEEKPAEEPANDQLEGFGDVENWEELDL